MRPKIKERIRARKLREKGFSLNEIAAKIKVSKGSISVWTRDVPLSVPAALRINGRRKIGRTEAGLTKRATHHSRREAFRDEGRRIAVRNIPLHLKACVLYWAEGGKQRTTMHFCNSDPAMIKLFVAFLVAYFDVKRVGIRVFCYDDVYPLKKILAYWNDVVGLSQSKMYPAVLNRYNSLSTGKRKGKLPYGTCHIKVNNVKITQHIFGALEIYGGVIIDP